MSAITPESIELLDMYARARRLHESFGVSLFGPALLEWPAWAVDLVSLLEGEHARIEAAVEELEQKDRKRRG